MRSLCRILLAVVFLTTAAVPLCAVTFHPGTYKLEWKIPQTKTGYEATSVISALLDVMEAREKQGYVGLVSSKCLSGKVGNLRIILDESKGDGKGYDVAYLFSSDIDGGDEPLDLSTVVNIPLMLDPRMKKEGAEMWEGFQMLVSDPKQTYAIDLTFGEEGSQITKKAEVDVSINIMESDEPDIPDINFASINIKGAWTGKIKTSEGDMDVILVDMNENGTFNDKFSVVEDEEYGGYPQPGDALYLGTAVPDMPKPDEYTHLIYLGKAASYDGKLYEIETSKTGDSLTIKPYSGDTGKLKIETVDGNNKPVDCPFIVVYSDNTAVFTEGGGEIVLLPGKYKCEFATLRPKQEGPVERQFSLDVTIDNPVVIEKDKTVVLKIGGPMTVGIDSESDVIEARRGEDLYISLVFTVGENTVSNIGIDRNAQVVILDAKGNELVSGESSFG